MGPTASLGMPAEKQIPVIQFIAGDFTDSTMPAHKQHFLINLNIIFDFTGLLIGYLGRLLFCKNLYLYEYG
jgi:hypothetical protein